MSDLPARVWNARTQIHRDYLPFEKFHIVVHPHKWADARCEEPLHYFSPNGDSLLGVPVKVDPSLGEDQVLLRYEVEA